MKNVYIIVIGKPERKRPIGRPRCDEGIKLEFMLKI
jgi:hypothetical protein